MSSLVIQRMFGLSAARMRRRSRPALRQNSATRVLAVDFMGDSGSGVWSWR
jgi:hypothetical protein